VVGCKARATHACHVSAAGGGAQRESAAGFIQLHGMSFLCGFAGAYAAFLGGCIECAAHLMQRSFVEYSTK
jgi:hypothetical protein